MIAHFIIVLFSVMFGLVTGHLTWLLFVLMVVIVTGLAAEVTDVVHKRAEQWMDESFNRGVIRRFADGDGLFARLVIFILCAVSAIGWFAFLKIPT